MLGLAMGCGGVTGEAGPNQSGYNLNCDRVAKVGRRDLADMGGPCTPMRGSLMV